MTYTWKTETCDECGGQGCVTEISSRGFTSLTCPECEGRYVVDAICPGCDRQVPLNEEGCCRACSEPLVEVEVLEPRNGRERRAA